MRLLKIGRDPSCDIVMHSEKVSSLHAEITLLNSGDIMLEDKGSRNGTFIMNQPIKANKPVNIKRGDAIRFADVELQWSQVPMPEDNSAYQGVYGIGSHFNNDIQIAGSTVSRYHATVKHGRDGKMYLFDHSKNGTTVDGTKIPSNTPYRIKRKSAVACGGVPVDLSRLPWPKNTWKYVVGIAAAVAVLFGAGWGVWKLMPDSKHKYTDAELYSMYHNSTVLLFGFYHYEVSAGNLDPRYLAAAGIPTKFQLYNGQLIPEGHPDFGNVFSQATGFFVSPEGHIVTNLHVAKPWLFDGAQEKVEELCKRLFHEYASRNDLGIMLGEEGDMLDSYTSQIKVRGELDNLVLIPEGKIFSSENMLHCRVLSAGEDTNIDVALVQSEKGELPNNTRSLNLADSMDVSNEALKVGYHMWTVGFPNYSSLPQGDKVTANARGGSITASDLEYMFGFDAVSGHGASGSPIFNEEGKLIGVLNAGMEGSQFNYGIKAKYVQDLKNNPYKK